jgi:fibronectin-binding autotransporter adhesin
MTAKRFAAVCTVAVTLAASALPWREAHAITITMEYTDEGDPQPHPENPAWDPAGVILKRHFNQAKAIWESLLPGPGSYEFDFHWDDDIGANTLGHTTDLGAIDVYIEINPLFDWFADPTPEDDSEFATVATQMLYGGLAAGQQAQYFPGTTPPATLETGFYRTGNLGVAGVGGFNAQNGYDLLTVILHEMGHVLGVDAIEPGEYNIYPQHVGGLNNVLVLEGDGGHLAGSYTVPGFLICDGCGAKGIRQLPSATDVLVIAEDQGITNVHLQRVGSLGSGLWSEPARWIGNASPDGTQGVYISHGGSIALSANAQALDVRVDALNSLAVQNNRLDVMKSLALAGGTISVGPGGTIAADRILRSGNEVSTSAGSTVRFNHFDGGTSTVNFNGNVGIGYANGLVGTATFNPSTIATWTIAQELAVGADNKSAEFVVDGGADVTSATGRLGGTMASGSSGRVRIVGNGATWSVSGALSAPHGGVDVTNGGLLTTGSAAIGFEAALSHMEIDNGNWNVDGNLDVGPSTPVGDGGGTVSIRNGGVVRVSGDTTVRGTATRPSQINVRSTGSLKVDGDLTVGPNGAVNFYDNVQAQGFAIGAAAYDNLGSAASSGVGGVTRFFGQSSAGGARFVNRGGGSTFAVGGQTEFRDFASAGAGRFDNLASTVSNYSGMTRFYDFTSAGDAVFTNQPGALAGYATVEFNGDSTGADGTFTNLPGVLGQSVGGAFVFNDRSKAGRGTYTNLGEGGTVVFNDTASADHGTFITEDNIGGNSYIRFNENSTAGNATFTLRANRQLHFFQNSTAANAHITARGGNVSFFGDYSPINAPSSTAGNAQIVAEGGAVFGAQGGRIGFSTFTTAGNATITAHGGTAIGGGGGYIEFDYEAQAGNATLVANGGVNGAGGGTIVFRRGATGDNARVIVNQGGYADFGGNAFYSGTSLGSAEGAGTIALNGSELRVGALNTNTTVSGSIVDVPGTNPNGRLTKVGAGKLTLAGANTYTGLTSIQAGALAVTGSIAGAALVESGGTLSGTGVITGPVTVAPGGTIAPGLSPGTIIIGALSLAAGSFLNFEIGATSDKIAVNGNLTLDGILNIALAPGSGAFGGDIFIYSGTLTNNGLTIGSVPAGFSPSDFTIDASAPGRIRIFTGSLPGDFDEDGGVDAADLVRWRGSYGLAAGASHLQGDADDDADVDGTDFLTWQRQLGLSAVTSSVASVPEPATGWSVAIGGLVLLTLRKQGHASRDAQVTRDKTRLLFDR